MVPISNNFCKILIQYKPFFQLCQFWVACSMEHSLWVPIVFYVPYCKAIFFCNIAYCIGVKSLLKSFVICSSEWRPVFLSMVAILSTCSNCIFLNTFFIEYNERISFYYASIRSLSPWSNFSGCFIVSVVPSLGVVLRLSNITLGGSDARVIEGTQGRNEITKKTLKPILPAVL